MSPLELYQYILANIDTMYYELEPEELYKIQAVKLVGIGGCYVNETVQLKLKGRTLSHDVDVVVSKLVLISRTTLS